MSLLDPSGEIQAYPFPWKINSPDFHCLFNSSWYQLGRGRKESFNSSKCFSALVKISPCGKLKKIKTNKVILTIAIERKESDNDENIPRKYFSSKKKSSRDLFGDCYLAVVLN